MVFTVTGLLEVETVALDDRTVIALVVAVAEVPPAPGHVVVEHRILGGFLMVADRVMAATQNQLIGQAQRAVPLKAGAPLLFAGAFLAIVIT